MISFNEWLRIISEESSQERMAREEEAQKRAMSWDDYANKAKQHGKPSGPIGSPEWALHAKNMPKSPVEGFRKNVEREIESIAGIPYETIIDASKGGKNEADDLRIARLIEDSWDDGTSPSETASMVIDLMKSMGYL